MKDFDLVHTLVDRRADVLAIDGRGLTVLHQQNTLASPDIVLYLLSKSLSVDIRLEVRMY